MEPDICLEMGFQFKCNSKRFNVNNYILVIRFYSIIKHIYFVNFLY